MPTPHYDWKRFWHAVTDPVELGPDGYLPDPEKLFGRHANSHLASFEALAAVRCAALLGEPGAGKSTTLRGLHREARAAASATSGPGDAGPARPRALLMNLGEFQSMAELDAALAAEPEYEKWLRAR